MNKFQIFCDKFDFTKDDTRTEFMNVFRKKHFKTLHIDIYMKNPYMLLLRTSAKNVSAEIKDGRIILSEKCSDYKTTVSDIILEKIKNCAIKKYNESQLELIFTVDNICYKLFVII